MIGSLYHRLGANMNADLCYGFCKSKWEELSLRLEGNDESAWAEAIDVLERRIRERFLSSVDALFAADRKPTPLPSDPAREGHCVPGFAIMALCCLLIDTLQGFRESPTGTNQQFIKFLARPAFGGAFKEEVAKKFVKGIRHGILHEAETRKWVIWREEPEGKIVAQEEDGYALNRTLFYTALKAEFESYLRDLRDPSQKELRQWFKKRMDDLSRKT